MTEYTGTKVGDTSTTGTSPLDAPPVSAAPTGASYGTTGTTGSSDQHGATGVAQDAADRGKQTVETARDQAAEVANEAKSQARALFDQTREQITEQGNAQQEKAASGLRSLADELTGMVDGQGAGDGLAADLAQQASTRVRDAASWLEARQPSDLLEEVRSFARRRPGAFLLSAAVIGVAGGRLTRGLAADSSSSSSNGADLPATTGHSNAMGTGTIDPVLPVSEDPYATPAVAPAPSTVPGSARVPGETGLGEDRI